MVGYTAKPLKEERGKIEPFRSVKVANVTRYHTQHLLQAVQRRICEPRQANVLCIGGTGRLRGESFALSNNLGVINQNHEFGEADKRCLPHFFGVPVGANRKGNQVEDRQ